jgi:hypothetical protein
VGCLEYASALRRGVWFVGTEQCLREEIERV